MSTNGASKKEARQALVSARAGAGEYREILNLVGWSVEKILETIVGQPGRRGQAKNRRRKNGFSLWSASRFES